MTPPSRPPLELWRRLARAQDAAVAAHASPRVDLERLTAGLDARSPPWSAESTPRRRAGARAAGMVGVAMLAGVAAAWAVFAHPPRNARPVTSRAAGAELQQGLAAESPRAFVADARSDLPLDFPDGSRVTFRAGSAGRLRPLAGSGEEIVLEQGRLEVHVVHAESTLWLVHAGPYRVRVTGTRFAVSWREERSVPTFELTLAEGAVVIDGELLGAGVSLRAGHRLRIASGVVLLEPLVADAAPPAPRDPAGPRMEVGPSPAEPHPRSAGASRGDGDVGDDGGAGLRNDRWLALAERGAYRDALVEAKRLGFGELCGRLDARGLLTLGDVARYSGSHAQARKAFASLIARFPGDALAPDAVFSLGRLAFEAQRPEEAVRWFRRYVASWPQAPLADQALGRVLECSIRLEDREGSRAAARAYLSRAAHGLHASLAREILARSDDERP